MPGQDKAMCLANAYLHKHTHTSTQRRPNIHSCMHARSKQPAPETCKQVKKKTLSILVQIYAQLLCTAGCSREKAQEECESSVQTRLICILPSLEVNMHESIKRYALKQTTRSIRITVPTSEPFILLLACNQADLVRAC